MRDGNGLEEQSDLKSQVKILEEKNEVYMRSVIDLEEEQRKTGTLRTQLDAYKRQMGELEAKLNIEVKRADKAEFDSRRLAEKTETLNADRDRLQKEMQYWKEFADELKTKHQEANLQGRMIFEAN